MSLADQNLYTLTVILEEQQILLSDKDRAKLSHFYNSLCDDTEKLSDAIIKWGQEHQNPEILKTLREQRRSIFGKNTGEKSPGTTQGNIPTPDRKLNKDRLKNAIHDSSGGSSQPPKPTL